MVNDYSDNEEVFGVCADGVGSGQSVPSVAIRWVIYNAFTNVELATLSNVSRRWREIVAQSVVDAASPEGDQRRPLALPSEQPPPSEFTRLLLPSLIRHFYASHSKFQSTQAGEGNKQKEEEDDHTHCVAWFHPDGIRFKQLTLQNPCPEICEEDGQQENEIAPIHPDMATRKPEADEGDHKFLFTQRNSRLNQISAASKLPMSSPARDNILNWGSSILYQWDGYSEAIDVLSPFGYSRFLLRRVLEKTQSKFIGDTSDSETVSGDTNYHREGISESLSLPPSSPWVFPARCDSTYSSLAVRGAIYARPEGYCQCWDKNDADLLHCNDEIWMTKRIMRKGEIERMVLPKVIWSKFDDEDMIETGGILRPCIQFLNIDLSHAVRLVTPKFEKPIFTPLTVFCVAVATEDGCFFSGLREKFEMGHMYPTACNTEISDERSPVCLNAEYNERGICLSQDGFEEIAISNGCQHNNHDHIVDTYLGSHCECFHPLNNDESDNDSLNYDSDAEGCANAVRGQLGPGIWHCYVAIFDGNQSIIRIDGVEESTTCASTIPSSFQACLDGITIGSDHSFDMSLCFGQGSDGEGEGALSELAFFKGRLHANDIMSLESHLMAKHGIPFPVKPRKERINNDYYSRLAHKLMDRSPSCANRNKDCGNNDIPVPLRYMTELRQVAWQQRNMVTGRRLSIQRIGDKFRKGSISEW